MSQIKTFYFNELRECCYVVSDESSECVIIDPGCNSDSEKNRLVKYVNERKLKPVKILLTHGHFDHVMGNAFVVKQWDLKTYVSDDDIEQLKRAKEYCAMYGFDIEEPPLDTINIKDGDKIKFGNTELEVIATPGHTQGGVCFHSATDKVLFSGDTLFAGSIGRTDHPSGNYERLMSSLEKLVSVIPPETRVLPGHGPETTISEELRSNPFLQPC